MVVEISDWNDLDNVRNDLNGDYVLVNDLDSETNGYAGIGDDFTPIGVGLSGNFNGTFDGQGYQISDLVVSIDADSVGLFGAVSRDTSQFTIIENLSVSGSVTNTGENPRTGGLAGFLDGDGGGEIKNCVSHVDVTSSGGEVGGLVGRVQLDTVTDSYATGSVDGGGSDVGGLVGTNTQGTIQTSYAVGPVTAGNAGGLVGDVSNGTVTDSYWDTETSGESTSDGGTGLTTAEMQGSEAETNMDGFDFENTWDSVLESDDDTSADGYPILLALNRENQLEEQGIFQDLQPPEPPTNLQAELL